MPRKPFTVVGTIDLGNQRFAHHVAAADAEAAEQQIAALLEVECAGTEWAIAGVFEGHIQAVDGGDGTEGQDRESYSDVQDRNSYTVEG